MGYKTTYEREFNKNTLRESANSTNNKDVAFEVTQTIYKNVIETKQHLNGEESHLFDDNDYKIKNIIDSLRDIKKINVR